MKSEWCSPTWAHLCHTQAYQMDYQMAAMAPMESQALVLVPACHSMVTVGTMPWIRSNDRHRAWVMMCPVATGAHHLTPYDNMCHPVLKASESGGERLKTNKHWGGPDFWTGIGLHDLLGKDIDLLGEGHWLNWGKDIDLLGDNNHCYWNQSTGESLFDSLKNDFFLREHSSTWLTCEMLSVHCEIV